VGRARSELLFEELAEANTAATSSELLGESVRDHVTVDIARRSTFVSEHRRHGRPEELAHQNGFELGGDFLALHIGRRLAQHIESGLFLAFGVKSSSGSVRRDKESARTWAPANGWRWWDPRGPASPR